MKGRIVVIGLASVLIYLLLVATFYFATPFMVSWGGKSPWYIVLIGFLQDFPFKLMRDNGEVVMSLIFVNAFFWTLCFASLFWFLAIKLNRHPKA